MNPIVFVAALMACVGISQIANAQTSEPDDDGVYIAGYGGLRFFTDNDVSGIVGLDDLTWDTGYRFGGALGYRFGNFRVEGEFSYSGAEGELNLADGFVFVNADGDTELTVLHGTLNAYYDIIDLLVGPVPVTPYLGAGIGVANVDIQSDFIDDDENAETFLVDVGAAISLSPNFSVVPSYRYDYFNIEVVEGGDAITSHSVQIGARLDF